MVVLSYLGTVAGPSQRHLSGAEDGSGLTTVPFRNLTVADGCGGAKASLRKGQM
jgi:hypothetical protein